MIEHNAFLAAIIAAPEDDQPRLVYADWLEEQGDAARAEFIRVQIELIGHPKHHTVETGCPHRRREFALLTTYGQKWTRELGVEHPYWPNTSDTRTGGRMDGSRVVLDWRRGFVAEISLPCAAFLTHAKMLFASQPITAVTLSDREPYSRESERCAWFHPDVPGDAIGCSLPLSLFRKLDGHTNRKRMPPTRAKFYDSRIAAHAALSAACRAFGRGTAGIGAAGKNRVDSKKENW